MYPEPGIWEKHHHASGEHRRNHRCADNHKWRMPFSAKGAKPPRSEPPHQHENRRKYEENRQKLAKVPVLRLLIRRPYEKLRIEILEADRHATARKYDIRNWRCDKQRPCRPGDTDTDELPSDERAYTPFT